MSAMSPVSSFEQAGIPCLDLTPFREGTDPLGVAKAFGAALEEVGFVVITGHGIPEAIIQTAYERARAFFDLPLEQKWSGDSGSRQNQGYLPMASKV